jgi:hypothetical protein
MSTRHEMIDFFEAQSRMLIQTGHFEEFLTGLHNAMRHGDEFDKADISCDDDQLTALYDGIEIMLKTVREMEA